MVKDQRETLQKIPGQKIARDEDLSRALRQEILDELSSHRRGLGFNELFEEVEDIISREALSNRLNEYEEDGLIELQGNPKPGQKKVYHISEKGKEPPEIEEAYEDLFDTVLPIWKDALDEYNDDDTPRTEILSRVLKHRLAYCVSKSVSSSHEDDYSVNIEDFDPIEEILPQPPEDQSTTEFYDMIGGELYKFYSESVFGIIYIHTRDKAPRLQKDIMMKTYRSTVVFLKERDEMWFESDVPMPDKYDRAFAQSSETA